MKDYSLFNVLFLKNEVKLTEEVACGALVGVDVLVVWLLAMVIVVVVGWFGVAVLVPLSWCSFVVLLEVIVDFSEEHKGFLEIGFLFVSKFGTVGNDLDNAA